MGAFVLRLFAPMQATRLSSYCGRDEKRGFSPRTFHEICENCKSGPCVEPSSRKRDTEMNSLATRSAVAECRARASSLRCRIRDLLEPKSRIKRLSRQRHNEGGSR